MHNDKTEGEATTPLDHGILNLPLHKRGHGSIDRQIDRWKADQAKSAKAEGDERRQQQEALRARFEALLAQLPDDRIMQLGRLRGARKVSTSLAAIRRAARADYRPFIAQFETWLEDAT